MNTRMSELLVTASLLVFIGIAVIVSAVIVMRAIRSRNTVTRFFLLAESVGIVMFMLLPLEVEAHTVSPASWIFAPLAAFAAATTWLYGQGGLSVSQILWMVASIILVSLGALAGRE